MGYIDNPISRNMEDRFGFSRCCKALLKILRMSDTPSTIGIFGPWGSGKTSLMRLLHEGQISGRPPRCRRWKPLSVWFNTWQYDRDEALWRALILTMLDSLREIERACSELRVPVATNQTIEQVAKGIRREVLRRGEYAT